MIYELKHFDKTVLKFSAVDNSNEPDIKIVWTADDKVLLPLDLELTDKDMKMLSLGTMVDTLNRHKEEAL